MKNIALYFVVLAASVSVFALLPAKSWIDSTGLGAPHGFVGDTPGEGLFILVVALLITSIGPTIGLVLTSLFRKEKRPSILFIFFVSFILLVLLLLFWGYLFATLSEPSDIGYNSSSMGVRVIGTVIFVFVYSFLGSVYYRYLVKRKAVS